MRAGRHAGFLQCRRGGGYGNAPDTEPGAVEKDVLHGYVSTDRVREDYRVVTTLSH